MPATHVPPMAARPIRVQEQDLRGKLAIVVGASKGIGRSVALGLATRGCAVLGVCSSKKTLHEIESLATQVQELYAGSELAAPKITGVAASITSHSFAVDVANAAENLNSGRLNILVLNAAFTTPTPIGDTSAELMQEYCLGNITNPQLLVGELVNRKMFQPDSRIVFTSSMASKDVFAESTMYAATKAAGEALIRTWAENFGGKYEKYGFMAGTTANSVLPGLTKTPLMHQRPDGFYEAQLERQAKEQCIPKGAGPSEVGDIICLLCRDEARWITGSVVSADGGRVKLT